MIFADLWFLGFLTIVLAAFWSSPARWRRYILLAGCLAFHAHYAGPAGMAPIIALAILVYLAFGKNRIWRLSVIALCVGALIYYKYSELLQSTFHLPLPLPTAVPLAISFFVFEFVHLLNDRNLKKISGKLDWLNFSIFAIFFPSLTAGPIKRYQQFKPELEQLGPLRRAIFLQSLVRIAFGYYKKFCLADALAYELPTQGTLDLWKGSVLALSVLQGLRIYLDFSGYSDIAIGLAGLFNIRLPENFSFPYLATNISDFWRRWHISLSTWIRDYVYILLGGNRVSPLRRFGNLMIAMFLCGLWHGAAVHFALWGVIHGLALLTVHFWRLRAPVAIPKLAAWALTFVFVQLSWLIFFYDASSVLWMLKGGYRLL